MTKFYKVVTNSFRTLTDENVSGPSIEPWGTPLNGNHTSRDFSIRAAQNFGPTFDIVDDLYFLSIQTAAVFYWEQFGWMCCTFIKNNNNKE